MAHRRTLRAYSAPRGVGSALTQSHLFVSRNDEPTGGDRVASATDEIGGGQPTHFGAVSSLPPDDLRTG
jgi:hypothetical protein